MIGDQKYVLLAPKIHVKITQPVVKNTTVIRGLGKRGEACNFQYGNVEEDRGLVVELSPEGTSPRHALVVWECGVETPEPVDLLIPIDDFEAWRKENGLLTSPKYKVDQIVFVKPTPNRRASTMFPSIGSSYETDVKILKVFETKLGSIRTYQVYIPNVGYATIEEEFLVNSEERDKIKHLDFKTVIFTIDSPPFFKAGETLKLYDGYLYNHDESVIVAITEENQKLLK